MKQKNIKSHSHIRNTASQLTFKDHWNDFFARFGYKRNRYMVDPGLYSLGNPGPDSPVFVSANYTLSFNILRSSLKGINCYILILNTKGINVWCAAGKKTFGTDELVHRIGAVYLKKIIRHNKLILPQLGATGVAAHEIRKRTGFIVEYGPVRAKDLPEYMKTRRATKEMRLVRFTLTDRLIIGLVETIHFFPILLIISLLSYFIRKTPMSFDIVIPALAGLILFPIMLPWIPTPNFSTKGLLLGIIITLPIAMINLYMSPNIILWQKIADAFAYILIVTPIISYLALNATGCTTFTSWSGVKREIFKYIPIMAKMLILGIIIEIIVLLYRYWWGKI